MEIEHISDRIQAVLSGRPYGVLRNASDLYNVVAIEEITG
jgi:hypothetical protein